MKDDDSVFPNKDYNRVNWCNANSDTIDALMESKELLRQVREFIYQYTGIKKMGETVKLTMLWKGYERK